MNSKSEQKSLVGVGQSSVQSDARHLASHWAEKCTQPSEWENDRGHCIFSSRDTLTPSGSARQRILHLRPQLVYFVARLLFQLFPLNGREQIVENRTCTYTQIQKCSPCARGKIVSSAFDETDVRVKYSTFQFYNFLCAAMDGLPSQIPPINSRITLEAQNALKV